MDRDRIFSLDFYLGDTMLELIAFCFIFLVPAQWLNFRMIRNGFMPKWMLCINGIGWAVVLIAIAELS